jgi:hypothetical protein
MAAGHRRRGGAQLRGDGAGRGGPKGSKYSGHFAGLSLIRTRRRSRNGVPAPWISRLSNPYWPITHSLGIDVRRECHVTRFVQQADGIDVEWISPAGAQHIRCTYLVGCDGGRSSIRKMAGFDFAGTDPSSTSK